MSSDTNLDSPQTSPRLPSPPPVPEVHINSYSSNKKKSSSAPLPGDGIDERSLSGTSASPSQSQPQSGLKSGSELHSSGGGLDDVDAAESRRVRPGTKASDMATGPPLIPLSQLDSPFQLQEYLKALYQSYIHSKDTDTLSPITYEIALRLAQPPEGADRLLWLYELCRLLIIKINNLIIAFFSQSPPCSTNTCPEMRAAEWQYLCAVHEPPKSCCAIDYCCHTLDWATNILTSPKFFPSRLTLGSESSGGKQVPMRHLTNIFRRVYRIFAHAWFQHREAFWEVESSEGLYIFFKTVCDVYNLMPEDSYTIPLEATMTAAAINRELHSRPSSSQGSEDQQGRKLTILRKIAKRDEKSPPGRRDLRPLDIGATARRHRQSPSRGTSVGTIAEASEDDELRDENSARLGSPLSRPANALESRSPREESPFSQLRNRITATARRKSGEKREQRRKGLQQKEEDKAEVIPEQEKQKGPEKEEKQEQEQEQEQQKETEKEEKQEQKEETQKEEHKEEKGEQEKPKREEKEMENEEKEEHAQEQTKEHEQEERREDTETTTASSPVHVPALSETEVELATRTESQDITDAKPTSTAAKEDELLPTDTTAKTLPEHLNKEEEYSEEVSAPETDSSSNTQPIVEKLPPDSDPVDIADSSEQDEPAGVFNFDGAKEKTTKEEKGDIAKEDVTGMPQFLPETL